MFLLTNTTMNMILNIFFLFFNNVEIAFIDQNLIMKFYSTAKI